MLGDGFIFLISLVSSSSWTCCPARRLGWDIFFTTDLSFPLGRIEQADGWGRGSVQAEAAPLEPACGHSLKFPECFSPPRCPSFLLHTLTSPHYLSPFLVFSPSLSLSSPLCFSSLRLSLHCSPALPRPPLPIPTIFALLLPYPLSLLDAPPRPLSAAGYCLARQTPAALFFLRCSKCFRSAVEITGAAEQKDLFILAAGWRATALLA